MEQEKVGIGQRGEQLQYIKPDGGKNRHRHRRNVTRYHFFHYFNFFSYYHKIGEIGEVGGVSSLTPVKSSLGIITHQGHISQVSANA